MNFHKADMIIIGGGINGMAIAGEAARLGLHIVLIEQNDIASGTSSKSTQLIHGGLRYLQQLDFSLVRKALREREVLLKMAPHLIKPMEFIIPDVPSKTPRWLKRVGLFAYDYLSGYHSLPKAHTIYLNNDFLKSDIHSGLVYSDAVTQDSRLVIEWALLAKQCGARILNYQAIQSLKETDTGWRVELGQASYEAPVIVNATGPWVSQSHQQYFADFDIPKMRLVKGSHLVLKKELPDDKAYFLECEDGRITFLTPYEPGYSLLGTTELTYEGSLDKLEMAETEISYLLECVNRYLQVPFSRADIAASFAGLRPLLDDEVHDAHHLSRDYRLLLQESKKGHMLLTVLGGKLTTHRRLALDALILLEKKRKNWPRIKEEPLLLPGGEAFDEKLYGFVPEAVLKRYRGSYGTLCRAWLEGKRTLLDLGEHFGAGLYQAEVDYLLAQEWVLRAEDLLWRRTRLGLNLDETAVERLERYICLQTAK